MKPYWWYAPEAQALMTCLTNELWLQESARISGAENEQEYYS